jgi:hypothetical protein
MPPFSLFLFSLAVDQRLRAKWLGTGFPNAQRASGRYLCVNQVYPTCFPLRNQCGIDPKSDAAPLI